jgi:TRAP-type C4-dicarboxylate transport system substrate-binding protein
MDLKGKKIRTYASEAAIELRKELGADAVTVEWEKIYEAFETGVFDVLLCPSSYFNELKLYKIAKYATLLRTLYTVNLHVAMNEKEYSKLRPDVQQSLKDSTEAAGIYCSELAGRLIESDLENLSDKNGIPVIHPNEHQWRSAFRNAIKKICSKGFLKKDLYEQIQNL